MVLIMADGIATGSIVYLTLFILFYLKFGNVEQNLIPYVKQMVFAYISV